MNNIDSTITIRQLLHQVSGLADVADVVGYGDSILSDPNCIFYPEEFITWVGPPIYSAGGGWNYCNTNYHLLRMIAESATGQPYRPLIHDYILDPLQLDSTFVGVYDSILYTVAHPWQGNTDNSAIPRNAVNSVSWSAGAIYSTATEMVHWYNSLMTGSFLSATSFNEMTNFIGSGNYGVGLFEGNFLGHTVWHHGGSIWGGYNSAIMYDTETGTIVGVLLNENEGEAFSLARQLLETTINQISTQLAHVNEGKKLFIYPNPANEHLNIQLDHEQLQRVVLTDVSGHVLLQTSEPKLLLSDLPAGIYVVRIYTNKKSYIRKCIKE